MARLYVDKLSAQTTGVAVSITDNTVVSGALTATSFVGDITGDVTGNASGTAGGLSGTPSITVASITGTASTLSGITKITNYTSSTSTTTGALVVTGGVGVGGDVWVGAGLSVAGTLTYEDVTNVDSVGIVTAGKGFRATAGGLVVTAGVSTATGGIDVSGGGEFKVGTAVTIGSAGVSTFSNGVKLVSNAGLLVEGISSTTTAWSNNNLDLNLDNGMVQFSSGNLGATNSTLNIMSSVGINTVMKDNDMIIVTGITSCNSTSSYVNAVTIDGIAQQVAWVGGSAPTDGGGSGFDTYSFNIWKVGNAKFNIIGNQLKTS